MDKSNEPLETAHGNQQENLLPRPRVLGLEVRFIGLISFLSLLVFVTALLILLYGLPWLGYPGWMDREYNRAMQTLDRLANVQKDYLIRTIQDHLQETHLLATTLQRDEVVQSILTTGINRQSQWRHESRQQAWIAANEKFYHFFMPSLQNMGFRNYRVVEMATRQIILSGIPEEIGQLWQNERLLRGVMATSKVYALPEGWEGKNENVLAMAAVIKSEEATEIQGVVILEFPLARQRWTLQKTFENQWVSSETIILSQEGEHLNAVVFPFQEGALSRRFENPVFAMSAKGYEGVGDGVDDRNNEVLMAYRHLRLYPEWGWGLVAKVDLAEVLEPVYRVIRLALGIGLVALFLFIIATSVFTRRLTRPLRQLTAVAQRVAAGERQLTVPLQGRDEMALLGHAMNRLLATIERQLAELEERVAERTLELSTQLRARYHTEQLLRESQARFGAILDNTN
ncbi:MAG: HAMP domain-containing protein, partial [Magnetococcales bacterium]|nr:HAMP domain-containing protein [Magnetococcales bacterium]